MKDALVTATLGDIEPVRDLIRGRIAWMDARGLHGWNSLDYLGMYPVAYFEAHARAGRLLLHRGAAGALDGALILLTEDALWASQPAARAYYVHNLVTAVDAPHGAGRALLALVEERARGEGLACVRLDCMRENASLNRFYEALGYRIVGECAEGEYRGFLREKRL